MGQGRNSCINIKQSSVAWFTALDKTAPYHLPTHSPWFTREMPFVFHYLLEAQTQSSVLPRMDAVGWGRGFPPSLSGQRPWLLTQQDLETSQSFVETLREPLTQNQQNR